MGARGPKPKPTNVRQLHGDRKDRINTNEPKPPPPGGFPPAPAELDERAAEVWNRLGPTLHARGLLTIWDEDAFAILCVAKGNFIAAVDIVNRTAVVQIQRTEPDKDGKTHVRAIKRNPALAAVRDMATLFRQYGQDFGLSPAARAEMTNPAKPDAVPDAGKFFS